MRSQCNSMPCRDRDDPIYGEPGVDDSSRLKLARGVRGDVPEGLKNKKIFSLDMALLVAVRY